LSEVKSCTLKVMREVVAAEAGVVFPFFVGLASGVADCVSGFVPLVSALPDFVSALFSFCGVVSVFFSAFDVSLSRLC